MTENNSPNYIPHIPKQSPLGPPMGWLFRQLFSGLSSLKATGIEKLPLQGPYMVATNHIHLFDGPIVYAFVYHLPVMALVAASHSANPLVKAIVNSAGAVWLQRDGSDMAAVRVTLEALKQGRIVGLAPEGTRSREGVLLEAKEGVAFLAYRGNVPIYPIGISGTDKILPALKRFRRAPVSIKIGDPFELRNIPVADKSQRMKVWTDEIMCRIALLIPEYQHGFYANHPRLLQLQAEQASIPT